MLRREGSSGLLWIATSHPPARSRPLRYPTFLAQHLILDLGFVGVAWRAEVVLFVCLGLRRNHTCSPASTCDQVSGGGGGGLISHGSFLPPTDSDSFVIRGVDGTIDGVGKKPLKAAPTTRSFRIPYHSHHTCGYPRWGGRGNGRSFGRVRSDMCVFLFLFVLPPRSPRPQGNRLCC